MLKRVLRMAVLVAVLSTTVVGGVYAAVKKDTVVAVVSLGEPRPLPPIVESLKSSGAVAVHEVFHAYQGKAGVYAGGTILPDGEDPSNGLAVVVDVHNSMLRELLAQEDLPESTRTDLEERLLATRDSGPSVYGLRLSGPADVVRGLRDALAAQRVEVTPDPNVLPDYPDYYQQPSRRSIEPERMPQPVIAGAEWAPSSGYLHTYTDGSGYRCFYNALTWNSQSQIEHFGANEGYEHDVETYCGDGYSWAEGLQSTSRPTGWDSNMPMPYLDYATVFDKPSYRVYTVGTFIARGLIASTQYYTFLRAYPGNASSDPSTKIRAQRTYVYGYSVWLVTPLEGHNLATGFTIPGTKYWTHAP